MANWLDIVLGLILLLSVIDGLKKGLASTGIGLASTVLGLVAGLWFYRALGAFLEPHVNSRMVANILGFFALFAAVIVAGAILAALINKLIKRVHLSWLNRLLGGAFGVVRGVLVAAVIVLVLMAFSPKLPPQTVAKSQLAPYVMGTARVIASAAPYEIRQGFKYSVEKLLVIWGGQGDKQAPPAAQDL